MAYIQETWRDASRLRRAEQALRTLLHMLEMRIPATRGRAQRISDGCCVLAEILERPEAERVGLGLAARFHCVGLLGVPDAILLKPSALSAAEKEVFDSHHLLGGRLVHDLVPDFPEAVEAIWWYQERPDGKGPNHMAAPLIPMHAGILGMVVALEAMANDRPFRPALPLAEIRKEVDRGAGAQFDLAVVSAFHHAPDQVYAAVAPAAVMTPVAAASKPASAIAAPTSSSNKPAAPGVPRTVASTPAKVDFVRGSALSQQTGGELSPLVRKEELLRLIAKGLQIKPLAPVVHQVLDATSRSTCSVEDVAKLVQQEQTLALRVLQLASSSAYNRGRPPENLQAAVSRLGIQQVRELVTGLGVVTNYDDVVSEHLSANRFWEHSLATGLLAVSIVEASGKKPTSDPFLWGMLHDVGRLILASQLPEAYAKVWDAAEALDAPLESVEGKLMMLDHTEVLAKALEHWRFSTDLVAPIIHHHRSATNLSRLGGTIMREAATVALADRLAHALVIGGSGNDVIYPLFDMFSLAGVTPAALESITGGMVERVNDLRLNLMCHGHAEEWTDTAVDLRSKLPADFHPWIVDLEPAANPFRLLCQRVVTGGAERPTLSILYLRDIQEREHGIARLTASEQSAGVSDPPLLFLWEKGRSNPDDAWLRKRRHIALQMPLRIPTFIRAVKTLLGELPTNSNAVTAGSEHRRTPASPSLSPAASGARN